MAVSDRYQLYVSDLPGETAAIRVYDAVCQRILFKWYGQIARRMLDAKLLPEYPAICGYYPCDQRLIRKLTLAATAIEMALEQGERSNELSHRLQPLTHRLRPFHHRIAGLLFAHPGWHFAHEDVICILILQNPCMARHHIEDHLADLVDWNVIQKIGVDRGHVFYDVRLEPHLHVFDAQTHELHDAPARGVLQLSRTRQLRSALG